MHCGAQRKNSDLSQIDFQLASHLTLCEPLKDAIGHVLHHITATN